MKIERDLDTEVLDLLRSGVTADKIFVNTDDRWGDSTHANTLEGWTKLYDELFPQRHDEDMCQIRLDMLHGLVELQDYLDDYKFHSLLAQFGAGLHYKTPEWKAISDQAGMSGWDGLWPIVDAWGELTGSVMEAGEPGFAHADEDVVYELEIEEYKFVSDDGFIDLDTVLANYYKDRTI